MTDFTFMFFLLSVLFGAVIGMFLSVLPGLDLYYDFAMVLVPLFSVLAGFVYYKLEVAEY